MNKEAYTENLPHPNIDWSTIDITQEDHPENLQNSNVRNELSQSYKEKLVSTPKPKRRSNSRSSETVRSNSTPENEQINNQKTPNPARTDSQKISNMLLSLRSHLQRYFEENTESTQPEKENWHLQNPDPQNLRRRPICKFYTGKGCYSQRCIYYHPPNTALNNHSQQQERPAINANQREEPCWFYLRSRCKYGDQCRYDHPEQY